MVWFGWWNGRQRSLVARLHNLKEQGYGASPVKAEPYRTAGGRAANVRSLYSGSFVYEDRNLCLRTLDDHL